MISLLLKIDAAIDLDATSLEVNKMRFSCLHNEGSRGHRKALWLKEGEMKAEGKIPTDSMKQSKIQKCF